MYKWLPIDSNFDRSLPFLKCRFDLNIVGTSAHQDGYFSELPNINTDGRAFRDVAGATWGYASENRFNVYQNFYSSHREGVVDGRWTGQTRVDTNVYEHTYPDVLYWSGYNYPAMYEEYYGKILLYVNKSGIEPDRDNLEFSSTGGTDSISVESSSNWTATTESDWITFAQSEFEAGTVQFAVSVSSNSSGRLRSGSISLENAEGDIATVEIEQRQNHILFNRGGLWINKMMRNGEIIYKRLYKAPFLELSKTKVNLKTTGGTDTVSVSTDGNWTATTEASFLTLSKDGNNLVIEGTATGETTASITVRTEIAGAIKTKEIAVEVSDSSVVVDLMSNWSYNTVRPSQQGYTIFMSDRYKGVASSWCRMKVTFSGFETFTFKYGSCAESNYDYVLIGNMDNEEAETSTATNTGSTYPWKSRSYGQQSSAAPNLTETFENDGGEHFFWVAYRKDGSADVNDDRGYIGILTEQISEVKNPYSNVIDA